MVDEKAKIVTDAAGPGSDPATAQPEAGAQAPKQEQPAPEVPAPNKAEAPAPQDKGADAPKEQKTASVSVFNFSEIMAEKKAAEKAATQQEITAPDKKAPASKSKETGPKQEKPIEQEQAPKRRGRPPKADKDKAAAPAQKEAPGKKDKAVQKPAQPGKTEKAASSGKAEKAPEAPKPAKGAPEVKAPVQAETPAAPVEAPRPAKDEQIVYIKLSELHAFKNHPFQVRNDEEMKAMVSSVRDKGVTQPAMDILPPDLVTFSQDAKNLLNDLQSRNERMFLLTFLVVNTAATRRELDNDLFTVSGMPTLQNLYDLLCQQTEPEAKRLATALEIYVSGSLNIFNHKTNVDYRNARVVCFDLKKLGAGLRTIAMHIINDLMNSQVSHNFARGIATWCYYDEFHVLLQDELTSSYFVTIWKMLRKKGCVPSALTQNVKDLLASRQIENIFENSDFMVLLSQAQGDRQILAKQLGISPHQLSYVTHSNPGEGLLFFGNVTIPFVDRFPKNTKLYSIMTTRPEEKEAQNE